jgi:ribonuclease VapC
MKQIVVDTSALLAVVFDEPESVLFIETLASCDAVFVCTATVLEALSVVSKRKGPAGVAVLHRFLNRPTFKPVAPAMPEIDIAYDALLRYGKGNGHPAQLNFGDLFSYATAKSRGIPLLYKGNDFAQTDIVAA